MATNTKQKDIAGKIVNLLRGSSSAITLNNEISKEIGCNTANFRRAKRKLLELGIIEGATQENGITIYDIVTEYLHGDTWRQVYSQRSPKNKVQAQVIAPRTAEEIIKNARANIYRDKQIDAIGTAMEEIKNEISQIQSEAETAIYKLSLQLAQQERRLLAIVNDLPEEESKEAPEYIAAFEDFRSQQPTNARVCFDVKESNIISTQAELAQSKS